MTDFSKNSAETYGQIVDDILDFKFAMVVDDLLGSNREFLISRWKQYIDYYEIIKENFKSP
jgi:hypothetical protein